MNTNEEKINILEIKVKNMSDREYIHFSFYIVLIIVIAFSYCKLDDRLISIENKSCACESNITYNNCPMCDGEVELYMNFNEYSVHCT